jgi:hypothetical protein
MKNTFRFLLVVFTTANLAQAQWARFGGTAAPTCFANSGTNLYVASLDWGVFYVNSAGVPTGGGGIPSTYVNALALSGTNVFAAVGGGGIGAKVFLSTNNCTSWSDAGMTGTLVSGLATIGTNVFAGNNSRGVYLTTNNGASWTTVNTGLTDLHILSLAASGTTLFAGTTGYGICLSTNNGTSWSATGLTSGNVYCIFFSGTNIFAGTDAGVYLSANNGSTWTAVNNGLTNVGSVKAFALSGTNLFAGTNAGVFLSTNNGTSWTSVHAGLPIVNVLSLAVFNGYLWCALDRADLWRRPLSDLITSVEKLSADVPTHFSLNQNYPNPFNPTTNFEFRIPSFKSVSLKIFDLHGKEVTTLVNEWLPAGTYITAWDAHNMPSGVYFYRLNSGSFSTTKKLMLMK